MEKDPARRFSSMREFASELRACLAELGTFDAERTFIAPRQVAARERAAHRARATAAPLAGLSSCSRSSVRRRSSPASSRSAGRTRSTPEATRADRRTAPRSPCAASAPTTRSAATAEHDAEAPNATDGNPTTYWETEHYRDGLRKPGVGVVLDAGRAVAAKRIAVTSDTPGFTATILAG